MDRILIILKKENSPRASSAPALGLNTIIFKHVYWYMQQTQVSVYRTIGPLVFFNSVLCPFQDYFSSYETDQSVGGRKRENPREKPPGTSASRTWLVSHVASAGLEPTPVTAVKDSEIVQSRTYE